MNDANDSAAVKPSVRAPTRRKKTKVFDCKSKAHLAQHLQTAHGLVLRVPGAPSSGGGSSPPCPPGPVMKTRAAFCLVTTPLTRISRQVCKGILDINRAARRPLCPINIALIKQECQQRLPELLHKLRLLTAKKRVPMERVSARLGIDIRMDRPTLLHHSGSATPPAVPALRGGERGQPPPLHAPPRSALPPLAAVQSTSPQRSSRVVAPPPKLVEAPRKRTHDQVQVNGADEGPAAKYPAAATGTGTGVIRQAGSVKQMQPKMRGSTMNRLNGCSSTANGSGVGGATAGGAGGRSRRRVQAGWMDTPDDVCFVVTNSARQFRRQLTNQTLRRGARKPWQRITSKTPPPLSSEAEPLCRESVGVVILD